MEAIVTAKLLALNRTFYQTLGSSFSQTRQRLQPGVKRILSLVSLKGCILDLGCANGMLARELSHKNQQVDYVGVDLSSPLLEEANTHQTNNIKTTFIQADLAAAGWEKLLPHQAYDVIFVFAVFHHLPSEGLRLNVFRTIRQLLTEEGLFYHSHWQPLNSARLRGRLQPWQNIGLTLDDVETGDCLLDWRHGAYGLRYVHHITPNELAYFAEESRFKVIDSFYSDGENNQLGYYQVWKAD